MPAFYLTPTAISDLALLIFAGFITGYLAWLTWRVRRKRPALPVLSGAEVSRPKRPYQIIFLTLAFALTSSYILLDFLNQTLYPDLAYWFLPLQSVAMTLGMVCLVQFAYRMPELYPQRRRESRIVFGVTLLLPVWELWFATYRYAELMNGIVRYRPSNADFALTAVFLWLLIVFLRQSVHADTRQLPPWRKLWQPQNRPARTARRLALISLLPVGLTAVLLLQGKTNFPITIASILLSLGLLFTMLLFTLVYLNYLSEQTSFMLRLNVITLAFFLAILGAVGQAMTPSFIAAYHNPNLIAVLQTLRFTPNTQGGYDISRIPYQFKSFDSAQDESQLGERLPYDEKQRLSLDFEFPFYDQRWSELFVRWSGGVSFGRAADLTDSLFRYGSAPAIYLIGANLEASELSDPTSGVFAHSSPEQLTLTWLNMPEKDAARNQYTYQLRLYDSGAFEMTFAETPASLLYDVNKRWQTARALGALPSTLHTTAYTQPEYIRFNNDLPVNSGPAGVLEDYHLNFRTALQQLAQTFEAEQEISLLLSLPAGKPPWLIPPRDLHLLRLIQEALTNIRKHAAATQVQIIATRTAPDQAQFIISDNGRGFDEQLAVGSERLTVDSEQLTTSDQQPTPNLHFRLNIMRERAIELGGGLEIRSTPGQGTQIVATIEIQSEAEEAVTPPLAAPLRVLLVDDHPLFLEGLSNLLKIYGVTIVGTAGNGLEAQKLARQTHPDLIVMDIEMPVCDGIEATRRIKSEFPEQRIIMLTVSATDDTLFAALKAGASGYLLKNMGAEELFMLIAGLGDGVPPIAPELAGKVLAEFQRLTRPEVTLTDRQQRILQLVADGLTYREIAVHLHSSERTVKRQMKQIMDALHLSSRAEAVEYVQRKEL